MRPYFHASAYFSAEFCNLSPNLKLFNLRVFNEESIPSCSNRKRRKASGLDFQGGHYLAYMEYADK